MEDDRRSFKRVPTSTQLSYRLLEPSVEMGKYETRTVNVSGGGIFVQSQQLPPKGSLMELSMMVPLRSKALQVIGRVVWLETDPDERGFAVEFYSISTTDRNDILMCSKRGSWQTPPQD